MKNIILFGFMGTGKTSIAKVLADRLGMKFVEMDSVIEKNEGVKISEIFAKQGESYFRKLERDLVKELAGQNGLVVSTGGGVVLDYENVKDFESNGISVCLTAEPEEIFKRIKNEKHRPLLLVPDPLVKIKELLEFRKPYYEKIKLQIDTSGKSIETVVEEIEKVINPKLEMLNSKQIKNTKSKI
jgi:shikimate kinase